MLGRAVKQHHPTPFTQSQKSNDVSSQPLKPKQPSVLNSRASWPSNSLKRSASEMTGSDVSSKPPGGIGSLQARTAPPRNNYVLGRLDKLHANVFFDENDFEDDSNIDLDDEPASTRAAQVSRPSTASTLPSKHSDQSSHGPVNTPASSAPLPWSSSPPSHYQMAPPKAIPPAKPAVPSKRRSLPWIEEEKRQKAQEEMDSTGPPPLSKDAARKKIKSYEMSTPQGKSGADLPWNKTASAVKEEQKRLRQGARKIKEGWDKNKMEEIKKAAKRESIARVFLSDEQKEVLKLVVEQKKSVFFTGSAGTGKSVLLRETIKVLRDTYRREPDRVAVTASTGLAACNVGGVTLHSFAGIGLGKQDAPELVKKIKRNAKTKQRWMRTKVLIVDEVSMVDGDLFDKLEAIARAIRNNGRPFGGIQLVITGDFFQLPPVPDHGKIAKFAFDAATWDTSISHTIGLTQVFRQKDPAFASILNEMRLGRLTQKSINVFKGLSRSLSFQDDFVATELFPTRIEVDNANNARMTRLSGMEVEYQAVDGGSIQDIQMREKLLANCMAPQTIKLKKGAQVMLIKNIDETLVNGSIGKVMAFMDEKTFDIYHEEEDDFQEIQQMASDDEGMTRRRKALKARIEGNGSTDTSRKWPLVRFSLPDGTTRDLLCQQEPWKIELPSGEVQASRLQVPLILAWALSIHKAQGQTLERVKVDLGKIFEKGQAYVALSRATSQEGLQVLRFEASKVMAHEKVRKFYDSLYAANLALNGYTGPGKVKKEEGGGEDEEKYGWVKDEDEDEAELAMRYYG